MVFLGPNKTYATSRLTKSSHYTWVDSKGGKHFIEKYEGPVASELSYLRANDDGVEVRQIYSIPTIQNINYSQTINVPKHPTITGDFKAQFTKANPATISFDIILKEDLFVDFDRLGADGKVSVESLTADEVLEVLENDKVTLDEVLENEQFFTVKELIGILESLKIEHRIFTLTTNTDLDDLLDNLVLENISYNYDSNAREITSCSINATRVSFQNLDYTTVSEEIIAGLLLGVSTEDGTVSNSVIRLENLYVDGDSKFKTPIIRWNIDNYKQLGNIVKDHFGTLPQYYWKTQVIEMDMDSTTYTYSLALTSRKGIDPLLALTDENLTYKVNFGKFRINVVRDLSAAPFEGLIHSNRYIQMFKGFDIADAYSLINTYPTINPSKYKIDQDLYPEPLLDAFYAAHKFEGQTQIRGSVSVWDNKILGYDLSKKIKYSIEVYNDATETWEEIASSHKITGGVNLEFFETTFPYSFEYPTELAPTDAHSSIESDWAHSSMTGGEPIPFTIMPMMVGSLMEVFIFCPAILAIDVFVGRAD